MTDPDDIKAVMRGLATLAAAPVTDMNKMVWDKDDPVNDALLHILADELLKFSQRLADIGASREQINDALAEVLPAFERVRKKKLNEMHILLDIGAPSLTAGE
jgi:hypothetical protein